MSLYPQYGYDVRMMTTLEQCAVTSWPVAAEADGARNRNVRFDLDLWTKLGEAAALVGYDRSGVLRQFARWYVGEPGAVLPQRPTDQQ